jgi:thiamine kinase-like enzyme
LAQIEKGLNAAPVSPRLCHNDLRAANILQTGDRLYLIDWELAGMGDPFFDLADFAINQALSESDERLLLEAYFDDLTAARLARFNLLKVVARFKEAMWLQVQLASGKLEFDAREISFEYFNELAQIFKREAHQDWLAVVAGQSWL